MNNPVLNLYYMKNADVRTEMIHCRRTKRELNKDRALARIYAGGDLSAWVRNCLDNYTPKFLTKKGQAK